MESDANTHRMAPGRTSEEFAADGLKTVSRQPTTLEANFMFAVMENNKSALNVDWDAVAVQMGYKNGSVASVRFGQIKKSLGWSNTGAGPTTGARGGATRGATGTPKKPRATKKATGTPKKAAKAKPKAQAKVIKDEHLDDEEDDGMAYDDEDVKAEHYSSEVELVSGSDYEAQATPKRKVNNNRTATSNKKARVSSSYNEEELYGKLSDEEEVYAEYDPAEQLALEQEQFGDADEYTDARAQDDEQFQKEVKSVFE